MLSDWMQSLTSAQQQLFKYIEDADLWRWQLPDSKVRAASNTVNVICYGHLWSMHAPSIERLQSHLEPDA